MQNAILPVIKITRDCITSLSIALNFTPRGSRGVKYFSILVLYYSLSLFYIEVE